jgi:hypothetical protein
MISFSKQIILLIFVVLLSACSTFTDVWQDTAHVYQKPLRHLLVFRATNNEGERRNFEDAVVQSFKKRGIEAEQGYQIDQYLALNSVGDLDKKIIDVLSRKTGADCILFVKQARTEKETVTSNFYGMDISQEYMTEYLEMRLLHLPSARLIWSGTIKKGTASIKQLIEVLDDAKLLAHKK